MTASTCKQITKQIVLLELKARNQSIIIEGHRAEDLDSGLGPLRANSH